MIFFCKNIYKEFLYNYEKEIFDEIIPYSTMTSKILNHHLKKYKFEYLINLYSLVEENDYLTAWPVRQNLIKQIKTKCKIADVTASNNFERNKNLKMWDKLIVTEPNCFELERRRQFFERLLEIPIPKEDTSLIPLCNFKKDYIVISLFTNVPERNYSKEKWIQIINHILQNSNNELQLLFIGVNKDKKGAEEILNNIDDKYNPCKNIIGLNAISLLPSILSGAKFLLSCETGTVHIANAVECKTICLSCGAYYGRFLPYNTGNVEYIFPDEFQHLVDSNNQTELQKFYKFNDQFSTSDINVEKVIKVVDRYIKNT